MAKKKKRRSIPQAVPPRICEAEPASGPSGGVLCGLEIALAQAVARRQAGLDVVVCGSDVNANRELAKAVESGVGPWIREDPHLAAGPHALPHFHQESREPAGHSFYETGSPQRKARKRR